MEDTADKIDLNDDNPAAGEFEIKCLRCGCTDVQFEDNRKMGSSATGPYGSLDLTCAGCGNVKVIIDT